MDVSSSAHEGACRGKPETWRMEYLLHVVLTHDSWLHRSDIAAATGRPLVLTPDRDGRIVPETSYSFTKPARIPSRSSGESLCP